MVGTTLFLVMPMNSVSKIFLVNSHHEVLPIWSRFRAGLSQAPHLITLDHHTDTRQPFARHFERMPEAKGNLEFQAQAREDLLSKFDLRDEGTWAQVQDKLNNDEHVLAALRLDVIGAACIVAHRARDTDLNTFRDYRVVCFSVGRDPSSKQIERSDCDSVIESSFLDQALQHFDSIYALAGVAPVTSQAYILDIDLDYFNTRNSLKPADSARFRELVERAELVTIAREPSYVRHCALDLDLSSEVVLSSLRELSKVLVKLQ